MAKKDVDEYFNKICEDYHELIETVHDMEEEANKGLVDPEKLVQLKQMVEPIKINYQRISYIMFLLNKPTKKKKQKKYQDQNKKMISKNSTLEDVRKENKNQIEKIREDILRTS